MAREDPVRRPTPALTVLAARAAGGLSRLFGRGDGHAIPGLVADRLDPGCMQRLAAQLPGGVVLVTGTNGKTTTTRLIAAGLTAAGERVVTNPTGSNMRQGILAALLADCDRGGVPRGTVGVFEVDEDTLRRVARSLAPRLVVVLNLFRDQLDRHADLDAVAERIVEGIQDTDAQVLLNADDPLVAGLGRFLPADRVGYFGVEESAGLGSAAAPSEGESDRCPGCGTPLTYSYVLYAQLGHYACPTGDFRRPQPSSSVTRTGTAGSDGVPFVLRIDGRPQAVHTSTPGTYSIYNAIAAVTACSVLGTNPAVAAHAVSNCAPAFGRSEEFTLAGMRIRLLLVKNPTGFAQVIRTFLLDDPRAPILMALNDAAADGRDVSWIWDSPLEQLGGRSGPVIAAGSRARDLALRLRYAGVATPVLASSRRALDQLLASAPGAERGYVLATYTAMLALRRQMLHRGADVLVAA